MGNLYLDNITVFRTSCQSSGSPKNKGGETIPTFIDRNCSLTHFKKLKIENLTFSLTSRTDYRICGACCKVIVQGHLLKSD